MDILVEVKGGDFCKRISLWAKSPVRGNMITPATMVRVGIRAVLAAGTCKSVVGVSKTQSNTLSHLHRPRLSQSDPVFIVP